MSRPQHSLPPEVVAALQKGKRIEAIKLLRKSSGVGLAEAKALVDAVRNQTTHSKEDHTFDRSGQRGDKDPLREEPAPVKAMTVAPAAPRSGLGQGEVPRANGSFWLVLFLLGVILAYYLVGR